jgi:cob(I)alamin adenosyltransferase
MSIATQTGDTGQTSLVGGRRISKGDARVDAYGTVDELIAQIGLARALSGHAEAASVAKELQRDLFAVAEALAGDQDPPRPWMRRESATSRDTSIGSRRRTGF